MDLPTFDDIMATALPLAPGQAVVGPGVVGASVNPDLTSREHFLSMFQGQLLAPQITPKGDVVFRVVVHPLDEQVVLPIKALVGQIITIGAWSRVELRRLMDQQHTDEPAIGPGEDGGVRDASGEDVGLPTARGRQTAVEATRARIKERHARDEEERFIESCRPEAGDGG